MSDGHAFHRGVLLFEQKRWDRATREFQDALKEDPLDSDAHAYLALCLMHDKDLRAAADAAGKAIELDPRSDYAHYAAAVVARRRNRFDVAMAEINTSLELLPTRAAYFGLAAMIAVDREEWEQALDLAMTGLEHDPLHSLCVNARARARLRLGQPVEAMEELRGFLQEDPEDSDTLTTLGWAALQRGHGETALQSFSESLRVDAENESARQGLLQALGARNPVYAVMLRYFLWIGRLHKDEAWRFQAVSYLMGRSLQYLRRQFPGLKWLFVPMIILDIVFIYLTWTAESFSTLLMTLNPHTRRILDEGEVRRGVLTGVVLGVGITAIPAAFLLKSAALFVVAIVCLTLLIPFSTIYDCHQGWPRQAMAGLTIGLAAIGIFSVARLVWWDRDFLGWDAFSLYVQGLAVTTLVSNVLVGIRPRR